jgi:hypothetical protein
MTNPTLSLLHEQPDFPQVDISNANMTYIELRLRENVILPAVPQLLEGQQIMAQIASFSLRLLGMRAEATPPTTEAFANGFAGVEYIATLLRTPQAYDFERAAQNFNASFFSQYTLTEFEYADRLRRIEQNLSNTYSIMLRDGTRRGETAQQLNLRMMGVVLACDLLQ